MISSGNYLLSGCSDGNVLVWDTMTLTDPPLLNHHTHNDPVTGCR